MMRDDSRATNKSNIAFFPPLSERPDFCAKFKGIAENDEQRDAEEATRNFRRPTLSSIFSNHTPSNAAPSANVAKKIERRKGLSIT